MSNASVASRDLTLLAPKFRAAVEAAIAEAEAQGYPVGIVEAGRTDEHQRWLYAQGRTRPGPIVTNAPTALTSWHGYFLAIDFMHRALGFKPFGENAKGNERWFAYVAAIFKKHGLSWGGDWSKPDTPHIQWGLMPASPQAAHKSLKQRQGNAAVWAMVGASDEQPIVAPVHLFGLPYIERGNTGPAVEYLQRILGVAGPGQSGYGTFGPKTEAAVRAFQSGHHLNVDGEVGDKTWAALMQKE
jgi:peptidoglycan L-alanyl-D-glutamate endopeptidase CwlK